MFSKNSCQTTSKKGRPRKITNDDSINLLALWKRGYSIGELSTSFNVSHNTVLQVIRRLNQTSIRTPEESNLANERKTQKFLNTLQDQYGVSATMSIPEVLAKSKHTSMERYGVASIFKLPSIIENRKQTYLNTFGVDHPMKLDRFKKLSNKNRKQHKIYTFVDGRTIKTQGHGDLALSILEDQGYTYDDILTEVFSDVKYPNDNATATHSHIFDIFIPKENRVIEVKGTHPLYGYDATKDICLRKMLASKSKGYSYHIWVFRKDGVEIIKD